MADEDSDSAVGEDGSAVSVDPRVLVMRMYMQDTLFFFNATPDMCAERLTKLPGDYEYEALLVEVPLSLLSCNLP